MTVKLETEMYGMTRGGKRVGPVAYVHNVFVVGGYPYQENGLVFNSDADTEMDIDIVVAGYTWEYLKPQVGDVLRREYNEEGYAISDFVVDDKCKGGLDGGLYTVVKRIKPNPLEVPQNPVVLVPEAGIDWGDWIAGLAEVVDGKPMEVFYDGSGYHHRFPKPKGPEIKSINRYVSAFGLTNRIRLTSTDGVISVELLEMRTAA